KQYQVKAMPSTFMVDRDGNIRHLHQGYKPGYEDDYQQQIRALLKE
ncbi:MAG: TlpA family protein disulfide reductase, partial [Candidatus Thiodiazotropha taylori]|nr:TlpA family protein disulfide reductase [Candidatus Thiodiazotropha taylori]